MWECQRCMATTTRSCETRTTGPIDNELPSSPGLRLLNLDSWIQRLHWLLHVVHNTAYVRLTCAEAGKLLVMQWELYNLAEVVRHILILLLPQTFARRERGIHKPFFFRCNVGASPLVDTTQHERVTWQACASTSGDSL